MADKIHCFLPCRKGSERVPRKNIKPFAQAENGLIEIKLGQLIAAQEIDSIVLSTNDAEILDYAESLKCSKIRLHTRCEELSSSSTSTDDLVGHARELIGDGHILWTHVTSPFVTAELYDSIIQQYRQATAEGYDSLMTTTLLYSFLWTEKGPMNYDRKVEKWPRTQTLTPVHDVNSAAFLASVDVYDRCQDRIGDNPFLMSIEETSGFDIDWPFDFTVAEQMLLNGIAST